MQCAECEKKIKHDGPLCKACHAAAHCERCRVDPKALMGLCLTCYTVWEEIKGNLWDSFLTSA